MLICKKAAKEAKEKNLTPEQADALHERLWAEYTVPYSLVELAKWITEPIRITDIIKKSSLKQPLEKVPEVISFLENCKEMEKLVRERASQLAKEFANKLGVPPEMIYEGGVLTPSL